LQSPASGSAALLQQVPSSALEAGADLVMHSTHKVLTAMTQAAMLHLNRCSSVNPSRISQALQVRLAAVHLGYMYLTVAVTYLRD
jgi:arginine/lysine/ornithine decarboxylase